ncbi:hypothetical protein FOMPIDRAFT_1120609 [Fomitopsis schrenkii]|uniref:Protein kinase domain-containing protein n=1 Tax=Fomitopsis schrenkii TaxID=2126942 RepID=S8FJ58_FOMSC|nr:hypothetical protein FOMPIDRAFT_1120609 [Fomitopsis schrenkii]
MASSLDRTSLSSPPKRTTDEIYSTLSIWEGPWRNKQRFLQSRGYMLRPRYHPDWIPSWRTSDASPFYAEDGIAAPPREYLMDARRIADDVPVYIKQVKTGDNESHITSMLSSEHLRQDPRNHSVPVFEMFPDDEDPGISYMVMPLLRLIDEPKFDLVEELIEFADQILEGLLFMHEQGVSHRDCTYKNLMMDASAMYPHGFHPVHSCFLPDGHTFAWPRRRTSVPVRYYFIDYGMSTYFPPGTYPRLVVGVEGRDQEVPELSDDVPYDPFKVDIYIMGNLFRSMFYDKYSNVDFLVPFFHHMVLDDPEARPDAVEVLRRWRIVRSTVSTLKKRWRLRPRDEPWPETVMYGAHTFLFAVVHFRKYVAATCACIAALYYGMLR